jgi:MFS family permease
MGKNTFSEVIVRQIKNITIEPVLVFYAFGLGVVAGAQINTNLLILKICHMELGYSKDICGNLSNDAYKDIEEEVQENVNNFQMKSQWISSVPIIFFSLIAGALSDEFGRKPLLFFPMLGNLLAMVLNTINYAFIEDLPIEFFYLENVSAFFGGYAVYYLGMYSFVTNVTKPKERAHRLARLDGMEILGHVAGTLLSPYILDKIGYFGNYGISAGSILLGLVYFVLVVKEPINKKAEKSEKKNSFNNLLLTAIATPLIGMKTLLMKKRKLSLKLLLLLQLACFFIYWLVIEVHILRYLYMLFVFEGFDEADYAYYTVFNNMCSAFFLMLFMPFLNAKLRTHDALMLAIIVSSEVISYAASPFCSELWQFYLATGIGSLGYCKYSVVRSLMSKSFGLDEVGKVFSILAVVAALAPVAGNPIFRQLYNATIDTFPGAFFLLGASLMLVATLSNALIYTQRYKLTPEDEVEGIKKMEEIKTIDGSLQTTDL